MRLVLVATAIAFAASTALAAGPKYPPPKPVLYGGQNDIGCLTQGEVTGLNPRGDNFLAVRQGPGTKFRKIDEIHTGQSLYICDERGDWYGVVYSGEEGLDCEVTYPMEEREEYEGPCDSGWVHSDDVEVFAE
jgi:hypothetical protein